MTGNIKCQTIVSSPPEQVFKAITDWDKQSKWMIGTVVKAGKLKGHAVNGTIEGFTGIGKVGIRDSMTITIWDPPKSLSVKHTGKIVRGSGKFSVIPISGSQSVFEWSEQLEIPFGIIGNIGWIIFKPFFVLGVKFSLRRFSKNF